MQIWSTHSLNLKAQVTKIDSHTGLFQIIDDTMGVTVYETDVHLKFGGEPNPDIDDTLLWEEMFSKHLQNQIL